MAGSTLTLYRLWTRLINRPMTSRGSRPLRADSGLPSHLSRRIVDGQRGQPQRRCGIVNLLESNWTATSCMRSPPVPKIRMIIGIGAGSLTWVKPSRALSLCKELALSSPSRSFSSPRLPVLIGGSFDVWASSFWAVASSGLTQRLPCFL